VTMVESDRREPHLVLPPAAHQYASWVNAQRLSKGHRPVDTID
jgi:hypothetical protein